MKICGTEIKIWVSPIKIWGVSNENMRISNENLGISNETSTGGLQWKGVSKSTPIMMISSQAVYIYHLCYRNLQVSWCWDNLHIGKSFLFFTTPCLRSDFNEKSILPFLFYTWSLHTTHTLRNMLINVYRGNMDGGNGDFHP